MKFFNMRNRTDRSQVNQEKRSRLRRLGIELLEDRRVLSTFFVDDDLADCSNAQFTTIQAAVTAADKNDKIIVCKGEYKEQVTIDNTVHSRNGLELRAKNTGQAIINADGANFTPAIVLVNATKDVKIVGFEITGPVSVVNRHTGILVIGGGSATIERNHITRIRLDPITGEQLGIGIQIGSTSLGSSGTAKIKNNVIDDYQKGGIVVDRVGSDAEIKDNDIIGSGPTPGLAQFGIQVSNGATAEIEHNEVSGNQYTGPDTALGAGIVILASGKVKVKNNEIEDNDVGVDVFDGTQKTEISHNEIERSLNFGVSVTDSTKVEINHNEIEDSGEEGVILLGDFGSTTGNTVSHNEIEDSGLNGIVLSNANNNRIKNNKLEDNGANGLLVEDSNDNQIEDNKSEDNDLDGFYVTGTSAGNRLTSNKADDNGGFDCHDDSTGVDFWKKNKGNTSDPANLCT